MREYYLRCLIESLVADRLRDAITESTAGARGESLAHTVPVSTFVAGEDGGVGVGGFCFEVPAAAKALLLFLLRLVGIVMGRRSPVNTSTPM